MLATLQTAVATKAGVSDGPACVGGTVGVATQAVVAAPCPPGSAGPRKLTDRPLGLLRLYAATENVAVTGLAALLITTDATAQPLEDGPNSVIVWPFELTPALPVPMPFWGNGLPVVVTVCCGVRTANAVPSNAIAPRIPPPGNCDV